MLTYTSNKPGNIDLLGLKLRDYYIDHSHLDSDIDLFSLKK